MDIDKSRIYFKNLIDENGIIQFTKGYEKDYRYGYAIEDQARALILAIKLNDRKLIEHFLTIVKGSWREGKGVDVLRSKDGSGSGEFDNYREASAEVLWSLGELVRSDPSVRSEVSGMCKDLVAGLSDSGFTRVLAYSILGLCGLNDMSGLEKFSHKLLSNFYDNSTNDWPWFEVELTYANALLPWALISSYSKNHNKELLTVGEKSLNFLLTGLRKDNVPVVVGSRGWWKRGEKMAIYDQQPIDVSYLAMSCISAYKATQNNYYLEKARFYYSWFEGNNIKNAKMIREDGACFDGIWENKINQNGGAESIICYLLASLELKNI